MIGEASAASRADPTRGANETDDHRNAFRAFGIRETGYRHQGLWVEEDPEEADRLVRLTIKYRTWGFGLCFLDLRNVKQFAGNHIRVYSVNIDA